MKSELEFSSELWEGFSDIKIFGPRSITENDARAIIFLANRFNRNPQFLEVGCWHGHSTRFWAYSVSKLGGLLNCVDHWQGSLGTTYDEGTPFVRFEENLKQARLWSFLKIFRMSSEEASLLFEDESLDLVFLDGDHLYESFIRDFESWLPKVKKGGILCGHDAAPFYSELSSQSRGTVDALIHLEYFWLGEVGVHPGVVKALYDLTNDKYNLFPQSNVWWLEKPYDSR